MAIGKKEENNEDSLNEKGTREKQKREGTPEASLSIPFLSLRSVFLWVGVDSHPVVITVTGLKKKIQ